MVHDLCIALSSPPEVKSLSVTIYLTPFTLYFPHPLPSGSHHPVVCVCEFLFALFICCFQFYIPQYMFKRRLRTS